jgi:alpha-glucoside transport system substrate-binding protein
VAPARSDDDGSGEALEATEAPAEPTVVAPGGVVVGDEANRGTVNVLSVLQPPEAEILNRIVDEVIEPDVDYTVEVEAVAAAEFEEQLRIRTEAGTVDAALIPRPSAVRDQAAAGSAVSLEDMGFDIAELGATFGEYFVSLAEYDDHHYGMPASAFLHSMVWYPKDDFDAAGYEVPETFEDLIALSDQIVADGGTPWCVGYESGAATGWPATDWMEDIMLATAGQDVYTQWIDHEIPFNDPAVVNAGELFGEVMFSPGYVLGGADQTPAIAFGDAPLPMFEDPPGCWLHHQASSITSFFPEDAVAGADYDWFPFPAIDQEGAVFTGEMVVTYRNAPEVRDFVTRSVSESVHCALMSVPGGVRISPNIDVGPDCYENSILARASEVLIAALSADGAAGIDASDEMPPEVGTGSFWANMVDYMEGGPASLHQSLDDIEASWPA